MANDLKPVLSFRAVTHRSASHLAEEIGDVAFDLLPGQIMLIRPAEHSDDIPLFDLAEGLLKPDSGRVEFLGRDWEALPAFGQSRERGRIGRVFRGQAWISNLDLYENLVLAQRHHTRRSEEDLRREAEGLMRSAGFAFMPVGRTHLLRKHELQQAQWARAFLGKPFLVLLDEAERDVSAESVTLLVKMVRFALEEGAAIMWSTSDSRIWQHETLKGARRYALVNGRLAGAEGNA